MRVLIFEIWHVSPQFETGLEIAELHAQSGDEVNYVNIGGNLPYVEWYNIPKNFFLKKLYKWSVWLKIKRAKKVLNSKIKFSTDLKLSQKEIFALKENLYFNHLDELKSYIWKEMDIGIAAASSYITDTNDMFPDTSILKNKFNDIIWSSKIVAESFQKYLVEVKPDKVYFRNGRVSNYRPILRICQKENINFEVHDRACDRFHYSLGPTYRHDWEMRKREMLEVWQKGKTEERERIGNLFFQEKRARKDDSFKVFAKGQEIGTLPNSWDQANYNIVFFNSSISEYVAVGDEVNPNRIYTSQEESLLDIKSYIKNRKNVKFYLRLHPNLLNQSQTEKDIWYSMADENLEIIYPDDTIDTYSLIDNSDLVICYLSTVGIEAAYAKKPVILLGRSLYEGLDVCYAPDSKEELYGLLSQPRLAVKNTKNTEIFGFYMKTHGIKHIYYEPTGHRGGLFMGKKLQSLDFSKWNTKFHQVFHPILGKNKQ